MTIKTVGERGLFGRTYVATRVRGGVNIDRLIGSYSVEITHLTGKQLRDLLNKKAKTLIYWPVRHYKNVLRAGCQRIQYSDVRKLVNLAKRSIPKES